MDILVDARPFTEPQLRGVGQVAKHLVAAYAARFPDDHLWLVATGAREPVWPNDLAEAKNVSRIHLKQPNKLWSVSSMLGIQNFVRAATRAGAKADAVFLPNLGFVRKLPKHIPSVLLLHDLSFLMEPRWFTFKQRLWHRAVNAKAMIKNATRLLAVSEKTKADAVRLLGVAPANIQVIPLGSTIDVPDHLPERTTRGRNALVLGSGDARKNVGTAIEAVRQLKKDPAYADVSLIVVGRKKPDTLEPWLRWIPDANEHDLATLYAETDVLLYPSWYEGFGLPLHEAARFGVRSIASTAGALPETAPEGTLFANPAKPHHWMQALKMAFEMPRREAEPMRSWDEATQRLH